MNKIGLVLSGGGARGFAHLGLLQALDELDIRPYAISGVSSGAIVGALYAAGNKPRAILESMKGNSLFGWSNLRFFKEGFFSMQPLLDVLKEFIPKDSFEDLTTKLFVTVTDFTNNVTITFSEGPLFQQVIASASVPVIFEPVINENRLLVDGGILNNFPTEPLEITCDKIIGSYVNKVESISYTNAHLGAMYMVERCFNMTSAIASYAKKDKCHLFFEPVLDKYGMFNHTELNEIFEIGYMKAMERKDELILL